MAFTFNCHLIGVYLPPCYLLFQSIKTDGV
jgi:hypothetical protein